MFIFSFVLSVLSKYSHSLSQFTCDHGGAKSECEMIYQMMKTFRGHFATEEPSGSDIILKVPERFQKQS